MVPEYPYPGRGVSLEILRGEVVRVCGIKRPKFAKESIRLKMQFSEGWGVQIKKPSKGRVRRSKMGGTDNTFLSYRW